MQTKSTVKNRKFFYFQIFTKSGISFASILCNASIEFAGTQTSFFACKETRLHTNKK